MLRFGSATGRADLSSTKASQTEERVCPGVVPNLIGDEVMRLVARNCPSAPRRGLATTVGPTPSRLDLSALAANRHAHVRVPVRARAYAYTVYTEAHASRRFVNWEVGALARSTVHFGRNNRRNSFLARSLAVRRLAAKVSRSFSIVGGETSGSKEAAQLSVTAPTRQRETPSARNSDRGKLPVSESVFPARTPT